MKQRCILIGVAILAALSVTLLILNVPTAATGPAATVSHIARTDDSPPPPTDYLIALPVMPPDPQEVPPDLTPEQAAAHARALTRRQAEPVIAALKELQSQDQIAGFQLRPDLHGVAVEGPAGGALEELSLGRAAAAVLPLGDEPPACAAAAAQVLPEQLLAASRTPAGRGESLTAATLAPQATDPSINLSVQPGSTWTGVNGYTTEDTTVTMRILRRGRVIGSESTTSNSRGYYSFYPTWQQCPTSGYTWTLQPGDVVEVTAKGNTVSTVVVDVSAWVDPDANLVTGLTAPGRSVQVSLYAPGEDPCYGRGYTEAAGTDTSGGFSADFTDQVDFDRSASATVYARDDDGNSTYAWFYAYRISAYFDDDYFYGYLKPEVAFTATLSRTGTLVAERSGRSNAYGYYSGWFGETVQPGDVISVSGGGVHVEYAAIDLDLTLDHTDDRAAGTTGADRVVKANFYRNNSTYYSLRTSCSYDSDCNSDVADGSGSFVIPTELDLMRGDYAYLSVYDEEGNYQYSRRRFVPAIAADLSYNRVSGFWGDPSTGHVTVTLKDSGGSVKETDTWVSVGSYDGEFEPSMGSTITPTDVIEVTDGTITETMTVQDLTARLDGDTGHLSGGAGDGHLVVELWDFRRDSALWYSHCSETNVTGGAYDLDLGGAQVGGQDYAEVWSAGADDHYTVRRPRPFTVNAQKHDDYVRGYSETPYAPITITLQRGGSPMTVYTTTSSRSAYYYAYLAGGTPVTITQGDTLEVQTGDGDSVDLLIPELTIIADEAANQLTGRSPASQPVAPRLRRYYSGGWYSQSANTTADDSGDYQASFDGRYWSRDCSPVDVSHRCVRPTVSYYNPAGHQVWLEGPDPQPVGPDAYEGDDSSDAATAYVDVQSHTFHAGDDTDWVSFSVPARDVGNTPYRIETFNLGWGMGTNVRLYDTDQILQSEWWGYDQSWNPGRGVSARWTPPLSGTYYLEIRPPSSSYAAYCDAVYDLRVLPLRGQIYLPLVTRSHW